MVVAGKIIDADTGDPVAGATVELWTGNIMLNRGAAADNGNFSVNTAATPDMFKISSASYQAKSFPVTDITKQTVFELEKNVIEGEGVFVTAKKGSVKSYLVWGLAALLLLLLAKEKK